MPEKPEAAGASLSLRNLSKRYGDTTAVDQVSLDIAPGEFVTLLGPSGSGKTTTLNMIAGFVEVSDGGIMMDGRPIDDLRPHRRDIGMVFQHYALFPHMTAFENVAFPLKQRKMGKPEIRGKVDEALALVRLEGFGDRYPRQLSGGQQQRVALARAIVFSPKVLLMDEPLGALDKKLREWLQLEVKRLHGLLGTTFVYVTHDQEEALVLSDRIAIFRDGRIEQVGTAVELYEQPNTVFVAEFIGDSNLFPGRVARDGGRCAVVHDGRRLPAPPDCTLPDSAPCVLLVRPERLRISRQEAENALQASVRQVIYLGSSRKLELVLQDGRAVIAREPAGAESALSEGDRVHVDWAPEASVVLPEQPGVVPHADEVPVAV